MAEKPATAAGAPSEQGGAAATLGSATYEVIRGRLQAQGSALRERMGKLDAARREVFGSIEFKLLQADRITTAHNCIPRDMVQLGHGAFLFGFNVRFGLKKEIDLEDVFAVYKRDDQAGTFKEAGLDILKDRNFVADFKRLYNVYAKASFSKFSMIENRLYMVFHHGTGPNDFAAFKWVHEGEAWKYADGRSETEFRKVGFPPQHQFRWMTPGREFFRYGDHPHISIEDRVFVECVGGDLTIKVEDNTATGEGVYAEPVEDRNQKVDDAEISYAILDHVILLKVRPYKEKTVRCFIYNEKLQQVARVDSIAQSCVLLPEEHGIIFPDGYYLSAGELKQFEARSHGLAIERVIHAPNGEDSLFVFYDWESGEYVLMPYRLTTQKVDERIACQGYSLFANGHLVSFRAEAEPQKHHMIQLRQTPFHQPGFEPAGKKDTFLYNVGNKEVVRCLAEGNEVLTLVQKEKPYAQLYVDLVKRTGAILDAYPWLSTPEGLGIDQALAQVREVADKAVDEFDKVLKLQREAVQRVEDVQKRSEERFGALKRARFNAVADYTHNLAALRHLRGELITLKEVRYADVARIEALEKRVAEETEQLASGCVKFLLQPTALDPYRKQADEQLAAVGKVGKAAEGREIEKAVLSAGGELELLIEIVNSLKIEDATETTRIIDSITAIYSTLNQVKAALKKRLQELAASEGAAQFSAQMKLLGQAAASYLDLCDTPEKCDEYLNRITVQIEELEGAFADFDDYREQLAERRAELYEAFEQRKIALVEQRSRKANSLLSAAERILKVIQNRLGGFKAVEEINTYMASDLMAAKVRETIDQLLALGDSVKADGLQSRLKGVQQEAVRQLKDRQELFVGGENIIQLGKHLFNVNTQTLELTLVNREGTQHFHLTSTKYFEEVIDPEFLATRDAWAQELVSENKEVYRAEYLAWQMLKRLETERRLEEATGWTAAHRLEQAQAFMGARYQEGYTKGIHDEDASRILEALAAAHAGLGLARYLPSVRACAAMYWTRFCPKEARELWGAKLAGFAKRNRLFPGDPAHAVYIGSLQRLIAEFTARTALFPAEVNGPAGEYLFHELTTGETFVASAEGAKLAAEFRKHLAAKGGEPDFKDAVDALAEHPESQFELMRDWVRGFLLGRAGAAGYLDEVAAQLFVGDAVKWQVARGSATAEIGGLRGAHARVEKDLYRFDYLDFQSRLEKFEREVVPRFERYHAIKQKIIEKERARLRLDEYKPRVLTTFVRSQLIDQVYLPLVGDNLAKQMGAAGAQKRTDAMGMLLLISPPGYGKTTLIEYLSNRLGLIFVKINGPAIGHEVGSLDPEEAPNAAAREEIQKLNLALEMGDNVLICVDDIQHTSPEFLQKFISLCDAQRRIEGVWRGKPRTYDLRGRKVVVVMAGNPYTESGLKFKIPDMLANRADTYNLGDIIGSNGSHFKASYLENAVTSNSVIAPLANKSQKDVRLFIELAESGEKSGTGFEAAYSAQEMEEILSVFRKMVIIREVVLRVNQEYIHSAAQADEFRTEPPFRLQGSYRNMNRLAEKVVPIMNDDEVRRIVLDHYRGESQTLTTGAEANLLKFKEMMGWLAPEEQARWDEIRKTFKRNQVTRGADQSDGASRVVAQLANVQAGLEGIQDALVQARNGGAQAKREGNGEASATQMLATEFRAMREEMANAIRAAYSGTNAERFTAVSQEVRSLHELLAQLNDVAEQQRNLLRDVEERMAARARDGTVEFELTQEMLTNEQAFLTRVQQVLAEAQQPGPAAPEKKEGTS